MKKDKNICIDGQRHTINPEHFIEHKNIDPGGYSGKFYRCLKCGDTGYAREQDQDGSGRIKISFDWSF